MTRSESGCQACPPGRLLRAMPTSPDHHSGHSRGSGRAGSGARRRGRRRADQPGGDPIPGRGVGRGPGRVTGRGAAGGRQAGRRTASPRRGPARPGLLQVRAHREAVDPVTVRWGLRPLPATATRGALHHMWCGQTDRRPRRTGSAVLRPVRRPTPTALRAMRTDQADRPPRPRRSPRHLRRLLPDARRGLQPLPATPAVFVRGRAGTDLHRLRSTVHSGLRALRRRPATDRPVARGTGLRPLLHAALRRRGTCAPAVPCGGSSPHPARAPPPAPTARACPAPRIPAPAAGSRTNSTNEAGAHPARCVAAPGICSAPAPSRSHPSWHRFTKRSPPPTPRAPR